MKNLFDEGVVAATKKVLDNIESELDRQYCEPNNSVFSNNEFGVYENELVSKSSMDAAFQILQIVSS
jgi:hypothetical protein